jgi:acyl-[acyl-carrier-protein]-phospholipid O-acyltransferase/long-chain-fatty-acid--[acyl-carrier-protein] ligase
MLGTPTFFKPYLRKIEPHKLKSLKYVIAGAEKTPPELPHEWFNTFGSEYLEGYGLTETTPVVAVNKPLSTSRAGEIGKKEKSVGKMVNGMSAKILNPETMEPTHPTEPGILMLSGINIFEGYLNQPEKTAEVLKDSWFTTGDIARFDEDGFLYIEGRLSRFSKIGGEMVPHATIENAIIRLFNIDESEGRQLVVAGRSDAVKGEALVILSTQELEIKEIATQLKEDGFANLWIPKIIKIVDHIPCLATGKLDLREIAQVAAQD